MINNSPKQFRFLLILFFLLTDSATPLSFNIPSFPNNIFLEGNAAYVGQSLVLTEKEYSAGRATYNQSFFLWENATGMLADFTTSFTFFIDTVGNNSNYGDGLAFFLAPAGSLLNFTAGSAIGLPVDNPEDKPSSHQYPFVAVEFDIFQNSETSVQDPAGDHVGIDVNSVKSLITKPWDGTVVDERINSATISYDSGSKNLSVAYTSYVNGSQVMRYLAYMVDLEQYLPQRVIVGFSAATGQYFASFKIISWSFNSTSLLEKNPGNNTSVIPATNPSVNPKSGNNANIGLVVGLSIGGSLVLIGTLALIWFILWIKNRAPGESNTDEHPMIGDSPDVQLEQVIEVLNFKEPFLDPNIPATSVDTSIYITSSDELPMIGDSADVQFERETSPRQYSYRELALATSNFSNGGFGDIYRGFLKSSNCEVAVKKIWKDSDSGPKEYGAEIGILSSFRHPNLVQLLGWCHEGEALLVYEFMPNGSLDSHLFGGGSLLNWEIRYRIAQDLASVLKHIQQQWNEYVVHRDIKSSNIMLDSKFNPKLGDFGLARFVDSHDKSSKTTIVAGTVEYMPPQYVTEIRASKDTDIFSFGVVALEIACGRKPFVHSEKFYTVVEWIWELYKGKKIIEAADPKLGVTFNKSQMECLLIVGLWCSHPDKSKRPGIEQVIDVLNFKDSFLDPNIPAPVERSTIYITSSDEY